MELNHTARRVSTIRKIGWLSVASMLALAMLAPAAAPTLAAADKVLVCHAAGQVGTLQFVTLSVPANSGGFPQGHFTEGGTTEAGHEFDYLGACVGDTTTTTDTSTTTSSSTSSTTSTTTSSTTTSSSTTQTSTTTSSTTTGTTTTPSQSILAETDVPAVSLPPTDGMSGSSAPSSEGWRMLLVIAAALLASVMVMAPTRVASRRR
ncbi:MAG: hypothetical protein EPO00_03495 [Chloroflexota bacterium]|nr:MAG: hypothetical protein EPO00_03495 [Chloroflexota bacterium]